MESVLQLTSGWMAFLEPYPFLRALQVILLFLVLASLVDRLISGVVRRITARTETDLDDGEDIAVELFPYDELIDAIHTGEVNHVLALSALSRIQSFWANVNLSGQSE